MGWQDFRVQKRLSLPPQSVEGIYAILSEIDGVKNSWQITGNLLPQTLERLTRSVIITSTGSFNRIEGNRLTDIEVESLYRYLRVKKLKTRDEQEIAGYLQCLELVFRNYLDIPISESSILKLHHDILIYSEKDESHKGIYKITSNRVETKDPTGKGRCHIRPHPPLFGQKGDAGAY